MARALSFESSPPVSPNRGNMRTHAIERRLAALYESAPADAHKAGMDWYAMARQEAKRLAREHGTTVACAAGVIAALSPRVHWRQNLKLASHVLGRTYQRGAFKANLVKAAAIRDGARPLKVLSGPKVRAFYRAIMGSEGAAVIDVWMLRAIRWTKDKLPAHVYEAIARAMAKVAGAYGTTVVRLQATVWTVVRGSAV